MNKKDILNKYVTNNFKRNRSIMIGMILSVMLAITVITLLFTSNDTINKTNKETTLNKFGTLQFTLFDVGKEKLNEYQSNKDYTISLSQNLGYSEFDSLSLIKNINLVGINIDDLNKYPISLKEGRLPENENEIVIISDIVSNDKKNIYKIGNNVLLDVKKYFEISDNDKHEINQQSLIKNEKYIIEDIFKKEYTVVGIISLNNTLFGNYSSFGYTAITISNEYMSDLYNVSLESSKRINQNSIKDFFKYSNFENSDLINNQFNFILDTLKFVMIVVAIMIILIVIKLLKDNFKSIYQIDLEKRYLKLYSLGTKEEDIYNCLLKESKILLVISNMLSIILMSIILIILKLKINEIYISFSIFGFILSNLIVIFIMLKTAKTVLKNIVGNKYIYEKSKGKKIIESKYDLQVPSIFKSAGTIIGYKNYKIHKNKFKPLINSITLLIVSLIVITQIKTYFERNYDQDISQEKPNLIVHSIDSFDEERLKEIKYNDFVNISNDNRVTRFNIIKSMNIKSNSINNEKNYTIISISKEEYSKYTQKLGLEINGLEKGLIWYNKNYSNQSVSENVKNIGDRLTSTTSNFDEKVIFVTDKLPFGAENLAGKNGLYITTEENINKYNNNIVWLSIYTNEYNDLVKDIKTNYSGYSLLNIQGDFEISKKLISAGSFYINLIIFFVAFIGLINGINTIAMILSTRKKEFSILKNMGAKNKTFNTMFIVQNLFVIVKGFLLGIIYGSVLSAIIYFIVTFITDYPLIINYNLAIMIAICIGILLHITTIYIFKQITKEHLNG